MKKFLVDCTKSSLTFVPTTTGIYIFLKDTKPTYIGKSVNLRARLNSHFENAKLDAKEQSIIESSNKIEYIVTDSEFKALLLESKLIQKYKPKYNVRWMDDKSYLYIKITKNVLYPKVFITRKEHEKNAIYFGPFSSVKIIRNILKEIRRVFPFCTQNKLSNRRCFYAKIHLCDPCPNEIESIENSKEKKSLQTVYKKNMRGVVNVLDGKPEIILKSLYTTLDALKERENYEEAILIRERILRLERLITISRFDEDAIDQYNQSSRQIQALMQLLKKYVPISSLHRIECYDMSTLTFENSTASMVVFTDGLSDKKEYKRFKIKKPAQSDFEMFDEVLRRRFKNNWLLPDLIVVDGGKPQVRVVQKVLSSLTIDIPLIGIAKRPDRIVIADNMLLSIKPPRHHPGFRLIQALRDESHRFAKKYHLYLRGKTDGIMKT